jgi:hypothetical protein
MIGCVSPLIFYIIVADFVFKFIRKMYDFVVNVLVVVEMSS